MKIALVNPPPRGELERHWASVPVLGVAYVAAALKNQGHALRLLDGKLDALSIDQIVSGIVTSMPDLIGITCMTVEFPTALRIARAVRAAGVKSPMILGGAHVNAVGARALEECPEADFACIGEGEYLVCELAAALECGSSLTGIAGLAHRGAAGVIKNQPRAYPRDYDALPFPAWELFNRGKHIPLLTHRGCPFECNFCGHNSGFKPRYRTPDNVLAEIVDVVARYSPDVIRFEDETFGLNLPRTKQILHGILERGLEKKVRFSAQTRVDRLDRDFVALLKRCNFETLELGVESGNPDIVRRMGKGLTLEQVERAIALAKAQHLTVWCKFILGHPFETLRNMKDTADFIARVNPDMVSVSIMTPYPGTPIFDMAVRGEGGYRLLSSDWASFDKYASGALELENVSLAQLKWMQAWCYLKMYLWNGRALELLRFAYKCRSAAVEMAGALVKSAIGRKKSQASRPSVHAFAATAIPTSGVAMPDSTLIQIRRRALRPAGEDRDRTPALRSWASPGA
jgi:anaerobic magnesium-protoporphyrin IX monomethyl ester cyclase